MFLTGTGLSHEPARAATFAAAAAARDAGVPVVVDIDYRAGSMGRRRGVRRRRCRRCSRSATLAVGTEEELAAASGTTDAAAGAATIC